MSEKKPTPILMKARVRVCPICRQPSYSQAGIHPQCAVQQADAPRAEKLRAQRKRDANAVTPSPWTKKMRSLNKPVGAHPVKLP